MPDEIQLIILSRGDFDHAGGAKEILELTGAKIVMPRTYFWLHQPNSGVGGAIVGCLAHKCPPFVLKAKLPIYAKDIQQVKKG